MTLPFDLSALSFSTIDNADNSRNPGGIRTSKSTPGHYLIAKMKTRVLTHRQARIFSAWLDAFQGNQTVDVLLPIASEPLGTASGTPKIKTIDANDGRRLVINGWDLNQIEALCNGDYVRFDGHKKVYKVDSCAVVDATGAAELILTRPLLRPVIVGELLHVRPSFCLAIEGKVPEIKEGNNDPQAYALSMGEVWQ